MKTTYKVTAKTGFMGHAEGDEFEAELDPEQERRALQRGSINKVSKQPAKGKEAATDE